MNLKKLVLAITFLVPILAVGQTTSPNDFKCGISDEAAALIKERLMENRRNFTAEEVLDLTSGRTITYIPLSIHNVANDASGLGKTSEQTIMSFLCGLNALYADQDVQFFIHGTIFNRISSFIYNNASSSTSRNQMLSYRVSNTLNLIMGSSVNNQVASWYDPQGDFVFLLQSMLTSAAKTEAHEIGHYFTLPHTFYGWENQTVTTLYPSGQLPNCNSIGSGWTAFMPERVIRTGGNSNCTTAADGFCDTPADYFSDRLNCPFPTFRDCNGDLLNPDESNIMSYAYDACVTTFSAEQKAAIAMDIAARNWVTNTPASTLDVTGTATVVSPLNGTQLGSITDATVLLDWTDVPGATWYYLEVVGTTLPGVWIPNANDVKFRGILYSANSQYDLSTTGLVAGSRYAWRVKGLNSLSTCGPISGYSKFEAVTAVTTDIKDLPIEKQMSFTVNNNPISTSFIPFSVYTAEEVVASLRIYSMDGREVISMTKQTISQGDNLIQIPAENLSNGMYVAVLSSDRGLLQQKLVIQR